MTSITVPLDKRQRKAAVYHFSITRTSSKLSSFHVLEVNPRGQACLSSNQKERKKGEMVATSWLLKNALVELTNYKTNLTNCHNRAF